MVRAPATVLPTGLSVLKYVCMINTRWQSAWDLIGTSGFISISLSDLRCWPNHQVSSNFCSPLFSLIFLCFKLSESLWNRFKTILLDQEMNLKKYSSKNINYFIFKNIFFDLKKYFPKNFRTFSKIEIFIEKH